MTAHRCAAIVVALVMLAVTGSDRQPTRIRQPAALSLLGVSLEPGDLIFRRTDGLLGTLVLESDRASEFTHVGIIVSVRPDTAVVHAEPSSDVPGGGHVVRVSLASFVGGADVTAFAVYRLRNRNTDATIRAVSWALSQARRRVPFDGGLNLADTSALYCTELVWRAYQRGGVGLVEPARNRIRLPLSPDTVILVSALAASPLLEPVAPRLSP